MELLSLCSSAVRLRTLHLGTAGEPAGEGIYVQRNALLTGTAVQDRFLATLLATLRREEGFDELRLDGFDADWGARFAGAEIDLRSEILASPIVDLRPAREAGTQALTLLSANTRYQVRRSLRGYGEVTTEWAADIPTALSVFDELVELHERRWRAAGQAGAFAHERQRESLSLGYSSRWKTVAVGVHA